MTIETAERLVELRKRRGISQEELAERLGVSRQAVSKWERGEAAPDTDNLIALADLYCVSLDQLLGRSVPTAIDPIDPADPLPNGSFFDQKKEKKDRSVPYPVLVTFIYLVLGFFLNLWHPGWVIFLTIPLYYLPASEQHPLRLASNPVLITIVYLMLGFQCNLWHPGWLIFFAIPLLGAATR